MKNIKAKEAFLEYRRQTEIEAETYNRLKTTFPLYEFPKHANRIWRVGMAAEIWGTIATILGKGVIDYLENWRKGQ